MKNILGRFCIGIAVSAITFFIALAVLEIGVRMFLLPDQIEYSVSPGGNAVYRIDTTEYQTVVKTNSLNMRDDEIRPKSNGEARIVCLGDSFTFGVGVNVEHSYAKLLEAEFSQDGFDVYSINAGGQGGNAERQLGFLEKNFKTLDPELLLLQVFIGNDFYDFLSGSNFNVEAFGGFVAQEEKSVDSVDLGFIDSIRHWLKNCELKSISFLWQGLIQLEFLDNLLLKYDFRYGGRPILLSDYPELESELMEKELNALERVNEFAKSKNFQLAIVVVPFKIQVFKRDFFSPPKYDYRKPNRFIRNFCEENGIPHLDFLDIYESMELSEVRGFYYHRDLHWTADGHRHASKEIAKFITGKASGSLIK